MDILLAHGYFLWEDEHERAIMKPYPPLGILYLSAYLKQQEYDVRIFDSTFQSREAFVDLLRRERPPAVGLYCNLMTKLRILELIPECRNAGAKVILGGPEPAFYTEEFLNAGADAVVIGEGEQTLAELLPCLRDGREPRDVAGIAYRDGKGVVVRTPPRGFIRNLDDLPFPDRESIDMRTYIGTWKQHHGRGSVSLITARGCPYTCKWCSHAVYGVSHRRRSPGNVVAEVEHIVERYEPDMLWYADDVFTIHHSWFFTYARLLKERGIRLPFECISRADRMNEEVVRTLAEMGCTRLWIGSESGSQKLLDAMDRKVTVERVQEGTALLRRYGIESGMFIMLGYEGEEQMDLDATVDHLKKANPDIFLTTVAYPIKGTPYYEQVEDRLSSSRAWSERTERDWIVRSRHTRRYYDFATRWMKGSVALHRSRRPQDAVTAVRASMNVGIGRIGMALTAHDVEG